MKKVIYTILWIFIVAVISSCEVEDTDILMNGGSLGAIMQPQTNVTFLAGISTGVEVDLNTFANEGVTVSAINVTKQLFTANGISEPVTYVVSGDTFEQTASELYADVPVEGVVQSNSTLTPGDRWELTYTMSLADGRTMLIGNKTTITFLCAPYPGVWTIEMNDSYGDGWQTNDGNGGDGIQITLDDGTVYEVGLCSPYLASGFECTPGLSNGTATVTIPAGTQEASWYFPGDEYGEISFKIYGPDGSLVYESAEGAEAGNLTVIHCAP